MLVFLHSRGLSAELGQLFTHSLFFCISLFKKVLIQWAWQNKCIDSRGINIRKCIHQYLLGKLASDIELSHKIRITFIPAHNSKDGHGDGESNSDDDAKNVSASSLAV